jgi:hypothetical protein
MYTRSSAVFSQLMAWLKSPASFFLLDPGQSEPFRGKLPPTSTSGKSPSGVLHPAGGSGDAGAVRPTGLRAVKRTPAARADLDGDAGVRSLFLNDLRFMSSINVLGLPAAVVPVGLVGCNPVGVQLIGSRYREDLCLDAAATIEAKAGIMAKRLWERR